MNLSTDNLMHQVKNFEDIVNITQDGGKRRSKKSSKKSAPKKGSKKSSKKMARYNNNTKNLDMMVGGKRHSKKSSKKVSSKKSSKKSSRKSSKKMSQKGGKRRSKKSSKEVSPKKSSKKGSKKSSKKGSKQSRLNSSPMINLESVSTSNESMGGGAKKPSKKGSKQKRTLPPALKAAQVINEKVLKETGADRKHWFGLIKYINVLRTSAKKSVKDEKDFEAVNKKIMDLFNDELSSKGKGKIAKMIADYAEEAMAKRRAGKK